MSDTNSSAANADNLPTAEAVPFWQVAPALEFMCWVVVALAPMLRLVNGAPVTDDQAVIQVSLVVLALSGALGLRFYNWRHKAQWQELFAVEQVESSQTQRGDA